MRSEARTVKTSSEGSATMTKRLITMKKAICGAVIVCLLASFAVVGVIPGSVQPARSEFGEIWLGIQVAIGAVKLTKELFSMAKFFLGPNPTQEAIDQLKQQEEQLQAIIDQENAIQTEITTIEDKLKENNLTQAADKQIAPITNIYSRMEQMADNGYDYYQLHPEALAQFSSDVINPINSIETGVEAFYQSLVVHPPGSPNCALQQARDIALDDLAGNGVSSDFSTTVESTNGVNIVAERPMYFNFQGAWTGGSCQSGIREPSTVRYFAEGTARPNFRTFLCLQNPSGTAADIRITYMLGDGGSLQQSLTIPPHSRSTVNVHDFMGAVDGPHADFSAKVESTNGVGIVAERPMFFIYKGAWTGGHVNAGITSPSTRQYFAEGTTRPGFDSFFCIQNPDTREADVRITYMKGDGSNQQQELKVPPQTRSTVKVNDTIGQYDSDAGDFSAVVESTNGVGLVVERPVYFNYKGKWDGGHCEGGATAPSDRLMFAEGTTRPGFDSFISLQNPEDTDSNVTITYMKGDGSNQEQALTVPARSRKTVRVSDTIGQYNSEACDFSALIEVKSGGKVFAERPVYFDYNGWTGGHDEAGVTSVGSKFYFAEGTRRPGFATYLCLQNPESQQADVRVTFMKGDGTSQVQNITVPPRSRKTINCLQTVQGPSLLSEYTNNLETLFKNSWIYQLMGAEAVCFARDYNPAKYGQSDDYRTNYYDRYMKAETEMFLACTEQLVMSQVDVTGLGRSQVGVFNLPSDAKEVLARADEVSQIALAQGVPATNASGVVTDLNIGLTGQMIASQDIVPAGGSAPVLKARVHGGSTTYDTGATEVISLPWKAVDHSILSYDCWGGTSPYNTLTLDNQWSIVRYRFDNLPPGTYDILDAGGNVLSSGTVTEQSSTNPLDPTDTQTYKLTGGTFDPIRNTRGGPAILLDSSRWTASKTSSGSLREMDDPNHYHSVMDPNTGGLGLWLSATGGNHYTKYTYDQENDLTRTITAGADMDICAHYNLVPKVCLTDVNGNHYSDPHGFVKGNITILPSHYTVTASYELGVTDLSTGTYTSLVSDSVNAQESLTKYDDKKSFDYDNKPGANTYHMTSGHQYKFTFKLKGHHYLDTEDNSNMSAAMNQQVLLDGLRIIGF
jgi:hypothetical protein